MLGDPLQLRDIISICFYLFVTTNLPLFITSLLVWFSGPVVHRLSFSVQVSQLLLKQLADVEIKVF